MPFTFKLFFLLLLIVFEKYRMETWHHFQGLWRCRLNCVSITASLIENVHSNKTLIHVICTGVKNWIQKTVTAALYNHAETNWNGWLVDALYQPLNQSSTLALCYCVKVFTHQEQIRQVNNLPDLKTYQVCAHCLWDWTQWQWIFVEPKT